MALAQEAIRLAVVNAGLLGLIGAPTYPMLRDVTERAVFDVLDHNGIPYTWQKQEHLLALSDMGSEIIFRSMDDPVRLVGTNLAWFGVDELTYVKHESFLRLQARRRHPKATQLCGFGVWTPNGFDWVYERFIGPSAMEGYTAILAQPYENRHIASGYYESLQSSYDERFAAQEVLGQYLNIRTGRVYSAFDRDANIRQCFYRTGAPLVWSLDFNVNPMCSVIAQVVPGDRMMAALTGRTNDSVEVLDELVLPDSNTQAACDAFIERADALTGGSGAIEVYGDATGGARHSSGRSDYEIIREFFRRQSGYRVTYHNKAANPAVRDKINALNGIMRSANGVTRLWMDPKCKMLARDLERVTYKSDASGVSTGQIQEAGRDSSNPAGLSHISDALGYFIEARFGLRQTGGPRSTYVA